MIEVIYYCCELTVARKGLDQACTYLYLKPCKCEDPRFHASVLLEPREENTPKEFWIEKFERKDWKEDFRTSHTLPLYCMIEEGFISTNIVHIKHSPDSFYRIVSIAEPLDTEFGMFSLYRDPQEKLDNELFPYFDTYRDHMASYTYKYCTGFYDEGTEGFKPYSVSQTKKYANVYNIDDGIEIP